MHPIGQLVATMERIYAYGMTTTSGGNLSIRDAEGDLWITPSRVDKGNITAADIVCIRKDGSIDGKHKPSSEYPFHLQILDARPDLHAVVHAHVPALSAFAVARRVPDTAVLPQARFVCGEVGNSAYVLPGSAELGKIIADAFRAGHTCVAMENHGFVFGGATLQQAFERMETLEFTARVLIHASRLGGAVPLTAAQLRTAEQAPDHLPEFHPGTATRREMELRHQLCDFARRGYDQRLAISTEGSLSARLDGDAALFTPFGKDRRDLTPEDIVLVRDGRREAGKLPSRACGNHLAVYRRHPTIAAVFNALPPNTTAFSIQPASRLDARIIPESYILLRDVPVFPYAQQYVDGSALAEVLTPAHPAVLYQNNGAITAGGSVLEAFDRMEVLENTAKVHLGAISLGGATPIDQAGIRQIEAAFL